MSGKKASMRAAQGRRAGVGRIISGGQTGADRGGLDAAIALGIGHGGSCPRGRRAEDGRVPRRYRLVETVSAAYRVRTEMNVIAADGTAIFTRGRLTRGSALTARLAGRHRKPWVHLDLDLLHPAEAARLLRGWLARHRIATLNVAGSRESASPGLAVATRAVVYAALARPEGARRARASATSRKRPPRT